MKALPLHQHRQIDHLANTQHMKYITGICMALILVASGCKKKADSTVVEQALEIKDVSYGTDPLQKMDVYLPAGRTTSETKALILIHGGAWVSGDKAEMNDAVTAFKLLLPDYAIFNINYRLATMSSNLWPTQQTDVSAAVNFIIGKAGEYKFNSSKMVIGGASAGAHLALLHVYKNNNGNFKAAVNLFGPVDMKALYNSSPANTQLLLGVFMGGTPTTNTAVYNNASPLYAVNSSVVPTIILHGTADVVVPISQSDSLHNRLANAGVARQYKKYVGEPHGVWSTSNTTDAFTKTAAFIKQHNR